MTSATPSPALPKPQSQAANAAADQAISVELGARIRSLRVQAGLSLEQFSQRAGVSRAMLSSIERGEKSPTLPIIVRIASGFGVSLSTLLGAAPDRASVSVVKSADRLAFRDARSGLDRWVLSPPHLANGIEFVMHRLAPKSSTGVLPAYATPTEKYVSVSEGALTVYIDEAPYRLDTGDTLYFEVKSSYRFHNEDAANPCTYYMVIASKK